MLGCLTQKIINDRSKVPHDSPNHVVPRTESFREKKSNRIKCKLITYISHKTTYMLL